VTKAATTLPATCAILSSEGLKNLPQHPHASRDGPPIKADVPHHRSCRVTPGCRRSGGIHGGDGVHAEARRMRPGDESLFLRS
jgi:hypothetical protein